MEKAIAIKPFDTLFFRDGKPFDIDAETTASINFPPSPMTIQRAIVSLLVSQNNIPLSKAEDLANSVTIKDIHFLKENKSIYPIPLDLLVDEEEEENKTAYRLTLKDINVMHNLNQIDKLPFIPEGKGVLKSKNVYISKTNLNAYLNKKDYIYYEDNFVNIEYKTGIALSKYTNTVEEGRLYRVPLIRLYSQDNKDIKIYVKFIILDENFGSLQLDEKGYIKLGGENKISFYEVVDVQQDFQIRKTFDGIFKIYLKTPAIFNNGYIADWMLKGEYKGIKFKLLTASVGKYKTITGFDIKRNKIKKTYRAVPEGSIFYFKTQEKDFEKIKEVFEEESISDVYKNEGFGLCLVGLH